MFGTFGKKPKGKNAICMSCNATTMVIGVIAVIASLVALIGVFKAHVLSTTFAFGTTSGSLSLMALALNLFLVKKISSCCPCQCGVPAKK